MLSNTIPINQTVTSTTMAGTTMMRTLVTDQKEMSVPGYLLVQDGLDYKLEKEIASGGFGTVYSGKLITPESLKRNDNDPLVAVKVIKPQMDLDEEALQEEQESFKQEVSILNFFSGNRLFVQIVGYSLSPDTIVMKFYPYGSIEDVLSGKSQHAQWSLDLMFPMLVDAAEGLAEMHKQGFVHSDIKPGNIMLNKDDSSSRFYGVLSDFGMTQIVTKQALLVNSFQVSKLQGASAKFAAPEVLKKLVGAPDANAVVAPAQKIKIDVYAFAIMAFEMVTRSPSWSGYAQDEFMKIALGGGRPQWPSQFVTLRHQDMRLSVVCSLAESCWSQKAEARPEMISVFTQLKQVVL